MALYHTVPVLSCGSNDQSADRSSGGHVIIGFIFFFDLGSRETSLFLSSSGNVGGSQNAHLGRVRDGEAVSRGRTGER